MHHLTACYVLCNFHESAESKCSMHISVDGGACAICDFFAQLRVYGRFT